MTRSHDRKDECGDTLQEVHSLLDPNPSETSLPNLRQRILQLYKAGQITAELATVQLLRIDIDEIVRVRKINRQADFHPVLAIR
jgi:hypothetical protein